MHRRECMLTESVALNILNPHTHTRCITVSVNTTRFLNNRKQGTKQTALMYRLHAKCMLMSDLHNQQLKAQGCVEHICTHQVVYTELFVTDLQYHGNMYLLYISA